MGNAPKSEKPRVPGVLLPGNFVSDDSMSFQFGNLGINLDDDLVPSRPTEQEIPQSQNSSSQAIPSSGNSRHPSDQSQNIPKSQQESAQQEQEQNLGGFPMHQNFHQGYPMYPMESGDPRGPPMAFYPDSYQHAGYSRDGKYRGGNAQSTSGGRGEGNSKFSSETGNAAAQPFPYGYPVYPYQFPAGSYGNQFYGYGYNPKFPGYTQSYANSMSYTPEEEYKHRMPGQYYPQGQEQPQTQSSGTRESKTSGNQSSASATQGKQSGTSSQAKQTSPSSSTASNSAGAPPGMDGNFPQDFKNSADFYSGMEYNSSFMSPPFYHPNYQAQQPQPGSRNY